MSVARIILLSQAVDGSKSAIFPCLTDLGVCPWVSILKYSVRWFAVLMGQVRYKDCGGEDDGSPGSVSHRGDA